MDNFRRVMAYYDKDNLPKTAVPLADGETGWAIGVYVPIGVYNGAEFLNNRAKFRANLGTALEPNIQTIIGEFVTTNNNAKYILYLYNTCALSNVTNVSNYILLSEPGETTVTLSNPYSTNAQMCIFVPGYTMNGLYKCTNNSFYTYKYVYLPIRILNGDNSDIRTSNGTYNNSNAAREVTGQSNTDYPIYIEPFV